MKESIRHWKQIVETSEQAIAVVDAHGDFIYANPSYKRMFSITEDITNIFQLVQPGRQNEMQHMLNETLAGHILPVFVGHRQQEGSENVMHLRVAANPFFDEQGNAQGCVILIYDITAEIEMKAMKDQSLEMFTHDLRTPLTVIRGVVQSLMIRMQRGRVITHEQYMQELQSVERSTDTLTARLNELIDLFRSKPYE